MSVRKWFYEKVIAVPGLGIPTDRVFSSGSVGEATPGDSPDRPFIVIRFSPKQPGVLPRYPVNKGNVKAWIHDEPGTMENIDTATSALEKYIPGFAPALHEGIRIMECRWEGCSDDLFDDHFGTNVVYADFQLTWKPAP